MGGTRNSLTASDHPEVVKPKDTQSPHIRFGTKEKGSRGLASRSLSVVQSIHMGFEAVELQVVFKFVQDTICGSEMQCGVGRDRGCCHCCSIVLLPTRATEFEGVLCRMRRVGTPIIVKARQPMDLHSLRLWRTMTRTARAQSVST